MRLETLGLLIDMRDAARHIPDATVVVTYEEFLDDLDKRQSVLFSHSIMGEAVSRLRRADPETADRMSAVPQIVGMQSTLIHGCRPISYAAVWRTIMESVPVPCAEVDASLPEDNRQASPKPRGVRQ